MRRPLLIAIGGFAGTGKTTICKRLSRELSIPRLGSDTIGRTVKGSAGIKGGEVDAYFIAYEVLFRLCDEFVQSGIHVIVDITLGWEFQWRSLDEVVAKHPATVFLPLLLRCPREQAMTRIQKRYDARPDYYSPPAEFATGQKHLDIWDFLEKLDRPDAHFIDARGTEDTVYNVVKSYVTERMGGG